MLSEIIEVYFESSSHAEKVAEFYSESVYMTCFPSLTKQAEEVCLSPNH